MAELAEGKDTHGAKPDLPNAETLDQLLANTGLEYEFLNDRTVTVHAAATEERGDSDSGNLEAAGATPMVMVMAQNRTTVQQSQASQPNERESEREERPIEEIIVTGTNIRGIAPESSPMRIFTREDIHISGAATAQEFIETLSLNFGGGSNSDIPSGLPNDPNSFFNNGVQGSLGSSVNLRGLGAGSTLVLLNGHRLAPSSGLGDFVDISMIPASAIERVEVMSDGASSIYGSDAVAGVVNFILRKDFDGLELSLRYARVTEGDHNEYRTSITGGRNWDTGNALFVYEFVDNDDLSAADRSFSQGAPLPFDLVPSQEKHSALATVSQKLTPEIEIFGDITFSMRDAVQDNAVFRSRRFPSSRNVNISAGATWRISDTWFLDFSGTSSDLKTTPRFEPLPGGTSEAGTSDTSSTLWTADARVSGTVLSLPGGNLRLALGSQYRREDFFSGTSNPSIPGTKADRNVYAVFGEAYIPVVGSQNAIPGVERLELNVSGRYDDYSDFGSTAHPKVGILWSPIESLNLRGSYSTSFKPPPLGRVGGELVGSVFRTSFVNSVLGLTAPDPSIADIAVLHMLGTGKELDAEVSRSFTAGLDFSEDWASHNLTLSATWFDIKFEDRLGTSPVPGNITPFAAPNVAFADPNAFPEGTVLFSPSQATIDAALASLDRLNAGFGLFGDAEDIEVISLVQVVRNLGITAVRGLDFDLSYALDSRFGQWSLGVSGTHLQDFQQQAASTTPIVERIDTLYNPIELKIRGRLGYARKGFAAYLFANYADNYRTNSTTLSTPIDSWTTFDLSFAYSTEDRIRNSILDNTAFRLVALNILDTSPPSTPSAPDFALFGYDPTNASPINRLIAFQLTKKFQ